MLKIVDLSKIELERSEQNLQKIKGQLQLATNQLDTLIDYQNEYLQKLKSSKTTTLQTINCTQAFLGKLNQAIAYQNTQIQQIEKSLAKDKNDWLDKKTNAQALAKLFNKLEKKHIVSLEKQEQKLLDDLVASNFVVGKSSID
jgi:flagellar FliJ protein